MDGMLNRRRFLRFAGISAAGFVYSQVIARAARAAKREKPNILLILADDLGWHQLGCYGSTYYETGNLDRFATESMRFTDAYAAAPVCSPTRASLMTGKYPARLHLTDFIKGKRPEDRKLFTPEWTMHLPLKEVTIAEALKLAGYACGHFGKWHLSKDKKYELGRPGDPGSQGFEDVLTTHKPGAGPESPYDEDWHHVRQITERSLAFIERNKDRPFFCYVSHNSIHRPEMEKTDLVRKYETKTGADTDVEYGHNNPKQAAMLQTLDKSVETLLQGLEKMGLRDNTVVIFFSDNGHLGPKDSTPLRGSKADLYEGGIRAPLIIRWPGVVEPGTECKVPVISNDFFPTFTEIAGLNVSDPGIDGLSLVPLLKGANKLKRDALYWHYPHYHKLGIAPAGVIRQGRYKLVEWFERSADGPKAAGALELFDLEEDISERHDLAAEMPDKTAELHTKLKQWRKSVGAQEMVLNPKFGCDQSK